MAGLILSTDAIVAEAPKPEKAPAMTEMDYRAAIARRRNPPVIAGSQPPF